MHNDMAGPLFKPLAVECQAMDVGVHALCSLFHVWHCFDFKNLDVRVQTALQSVPNLDLSTMPRVFNEYDTNDNNHPIR